MKKIIYLFVLAFFGLFMCTSCTSKKAKTEAVNEAKNYIVNNQELLCFGSINLITSIRDSKVEIIWKEDGKVVDSIKSKGEGIEEHTLSYEIKYDKITNDGSLKIVLYPYSFADIQNMVEKQFVNLTASVDLIKELTGGLYSITYISEKPSILDNDGNFNKPVGDASFKMDYIVAIPTLNISKDYEATVNVDGYDAEQINTLLASVETYIKENQATTILESNALVTSYPDNSDVTITWTEKGQKRVNVIQKGEELVNTTYTYTIALGSATLTGSLDFKVYPKTLQAVANWFISQVPKGLYESIDYIDTEYLDIYQIEWHSGDTSVLTDEGIYIKPTVDTDVVISYIVSVPGEAKTLEGSFEITVIGVTDSEKIDIISKWLLNEVETELWIDSDIDMPKVDNQFDVELVWTTTNPDVISLEGKVTRFVFDRYVELTCKIVVGDYQNILSFPMKVKAMPLEGMSMENIIENFVQAIAVSSIKRYNFNINDDYKNITQSYNALAFFRNEWQPKIEYIAPAGNDNRPGTIKTKHFVVVHDTANNRDGATALMHAKYVTQGGGGTSFHYVVGNDGIYHLIPDNEVAYHAGDSTKYDYQLYDTGVPALTERANLGISDDGYFTFNGVKSNIHIPEDTIQKRICSSGIYYEIGENGNYWLNENYYNTTYQFISNRGGNNNSIGIETCVDQGTDYFKTLMINANLVAKLCTDNGFSVDQVLQHNNFSGKPCPNAMRQAGFWQVFRDWVSEIKFGMATFEGYKFEYQSLSSILNYKGFIDRIVSTNTEVKYTITVKNSTDEVVFTNTFTTILDKFAK